MAVDDLMERISDYANRADPYPLYAELRAAGRVVRQRGGVYMVGGYYDIDLLLHDPRLSSDFRNCAASHRDLFEDEPGKPLRFIRMDDPEHQRLRSVATRPFGPPHTPGRIDASRVEISRIAEELVAKFDGREQIDVVDDFAYPLPVAVICRLLGVPREDQPTFHQWADVIVDSLDRKPGPDAEKRIQAAMRARTDMGSYLVNLAEGRRGRPEDDMLSAFVNEQDPDAELTREELAATSVLLFVAGHETTVNLITNGALTLLRHPDQFELLRRDGDLMPNAVEELLRFEPPVHFLVRFPLTDIEVADTVIPQGTPVMLILASGSRDPERFTDPERFDITREDNQHFGFGGGVHSCYGAPLARTETCIALDTLLPRLHSATLLQDPPPYRQSSVLRGPRHLPVNL